MPNLVSYQVYLPSMSPWIKIHDGWVRNWKSWTNTNAECKAQGVTMKSSSAREMTRKNDLAFLITYMVGYAHTHTQKGISCTIKRSSLLAHSSFLNDTVIEFAMLNISAGGEGEAKCWDGKQRNSSGYHVSCLIHTFKGKTPILKFAVRSLKT